MRGKWHYTHCWTIKKEWNKLRDIPIAADKLIKVRQDRARLIVARMRIEDYNHFLLAFQR